MLALSAVTVRAQSVTVLGEITGETVVRGSLIITIESDDGSTVDAMVAGGIDCAVGYAGWFTVEMAPSELSAKYNYVTAFTELPEYGWEVGYMYNAWENISVFESNIEFNIDGVIKKAIKEITIDNKKYTCGSEAVRVLRNNLGCIKYKVDSEGYIKTIEHISKPKLSVSNAVYNNGFEGLKYKITDSTVAAYPTSSDKNGFTEFKNGARFDFDVMSYDKDGNARLIVIKDVNKPMMGVIVSAKSAKHWIVLGTDGVEYGYVFGEQLDPLLWEKSIFVVQFDYDYMFDEGNNGIILNGTDFENAVYNPTENTFNSEPADEMTFMNITNEKNEKGSPECEIITPDKNMLYSGTVYTSSYGQKIVRITKSVSKSGLPTVKFDAYESKDDSSKFHLTADYSKNGFDGNGTIFLAVYRGTALDCVFTYKLQDGEQSGSEICQDVYYKPGTDWKNYSVVGYVWYDDMKPIYPSCPIDIDYR